jgi:adenine specific DNA methylase Mod
MPHISVLELISLKVKGIIKGLPDSYDMSRHQNLVLHGDCLNAIEELKSTHTGHIKLIYIDPPFFSGTNYTLKKKGEGNHSAAPSLDEVQTYSDRWEGGLNEYLDFMRVRLKGMWKLLRDDGSIWIHLDWHVSHYVKIMLDEIFGYQNFVNEIVWKRTNSPKAQSTGLGSQHDVILLFAKDVSNFRVKPIYREMDEKGLKPYGYKDEKGRFRLIEIEAHGIQRTKERRQFEWRGRIAPYLYRRATLDKWWEEGIIYTSKNGRYSKKQYLSDVPGIPVSDLWFDIAPLQGSSAEYSGFLTQKPEALLERIISCSSESGDTVADFFVGSGTTAVSAQKLGRSWIVCDSSPEAISLTQHRLNSLKEIEPSLQWSLTQV